MGITEDLKQKIKSFNASLKKNMIPLKSTGDFALSQQMNAAIQSASAPKPSIQSTIEGDVAARKKAFNDVAANAKILMNTYDTNLTNAINLLDSYTNYVDENKDLKKQLDQMGGDIDTNDRKTYYEDEAIDSLNYYYSWMISIYFLLVSIFAICWVLFPSLYSNTVKGVALLFFMIYPLFSTRLLKYIFYLYNQVLELLPNKANSSK
jgi:hypothetical protein